MPSCFWLMLPSQKAHFWGYLESKLTGGLQGSMWVLSGPLEVTEKSQVCDGRDSNPRPSSISRTWRQHTNHSATASKYILPNHRCVLYGGKSNAFLSPLTLISTLVSSSAFHFHNHDCVHQRPFNETLHHLCSTIIFLMTFFCNFPAHFIRLQTRFLTMFLPFHKTKRLDFEVLLYCRTSTWISFHANPVTTSLDCTSTKLLNNTQKLLRIQPGDRITHAYQTYGVPQRLLLLRHFPSAAWS